MRLISVLLIVVVLAVARPAGAQWSAPSGFIRAPAEAASAEAMDLRRPQGITWIDFSSGLLGAIIGVVIAIAICDDEPDRSCPGGTPVIGGAIGAAVGVAVGRAAGGRR